MRGAAEGMTAIERELEAIAAGVVVEAPLAARRGLRRRRAAPELVGRLHGPGRLGVDQRAQALQPRQVQRHGAVQRDALALGRIVAGEAGGGRVLAGPRHQRLHVGLLLELRTLRGQHPAAARVRFAPQLHQPVAIAGVGGIGLEAAGPRLVVGLVPVAAAEPGHGRPRALRPRAAGAQRDAVVARVHARAAAQPGLALGAGNQV